MMRISSWGSGSDGQLGHGDNNDINKPKIIDKLSHVMPKAIAGGGSHTLLVSNIGELYSFGLNDCGQIGNGDTKSVLEPIKISFGSEKIVDVAGGWNHSMALTGTLHSNTNKSIIISDSGTTYVWGNNDHGQLGLLSPSTSDLTSQPLNSPLSTAKKPPFKFKARQSVKSAHQLTPVTLPTPQPFSQLVCGLRHSAAIDRHGVVYTWGQGKFGQLGLANDTCHNVTTPTALDAALFDGNRVVKVACGARHTLFLTDACQVYACGANNYGQLGVSSVSEDRSSPLLIAALNNIVDIACGWNFSVALTNDGRVYSWGRNNYGQLGIGTFEDKSTPQLLASIANEHKISAISCGSEHTVALTDLSQVLTWGWSEHGQLGHGDEKITPLPRVVHSLSNKHIVKVVCGNGYSIAVEALEAPRVM